MPDIRRCGIYGCRSNSREHKSLRFFNFPARDNPLYEIWLACVPESDERLRMQRRPYICSRHFHEKDVGFRRLATGAVPALFLEAPPGFAEEEQARLDAIEAENKEKERLLNLVNDAVFEWCRRAHDYSDTAPYCTARRELCKIATKVRNLVGATLTIHVDDYWLRKFRRSHLCHLGGNDLNESRNKTLDLPSIILELDPTATILSEDEIEVLMKQEEEKLIQNELQRREAKRIKLSQSENSPKNGKNKGKAHAAKAALQEYYNQTKDYSQYDSPSEDSRYYDQSRDFSRYESPSEDSRHDDKSGRNESIDLTEEEIECYQEIDDAEEISDPVIDSYKQALEHLKPLEDFALRQENYRAIGLLSTLEIIFKNPK